MPRYETVHIKIDDNSISNGDAQTVIHPVWWTVSIYDGPAVYELNSQKFSRSQRFIFAVLWYIAEVNNGGHRQFFSNSTGIVWKDALEALNALDAPELVTILEKAAARLGGSPALDRTLRTAQLETYDPNFKDLDDGFYDAEKKIDIDDRMIKFIRSRPSDFYFDGEIKRVVLPGRKG